MADFSTPFADDPRPASFYLGCAYDLPARTASFDPDHRVDYEARDLCTHGVVVGMTGSGKTGLCISLLEEAALDGIPCIMVDPKGDLSNLLLQFPEQRPEDFLPWLNQEEAEQRGQSLEDYARQLAERWRQGLAETGQSARRIAELNARSEYRIYTPGSEAGLSLSILQSFNAPPPGILREDRNLKIDATASALLGLTGISADPVQSKEHVLIATLLQTAWEKGRDLDLPTLIEQIQQPPISKIGALDVDTHLDEKKRRKLATALNNILASPSFSLWLEGDPLDLGKLLQGSGGRTRQLIFSVAHLDDAQRMFFITLLLTEVLSWTRKQTGSTNLRAILYFDEVFGYLPPHPGNPPSKQPLMTLFKQARAFGVGVLLATQNPVDIDYKALSNAGTWFVGKLQTERDKARLIEGLEGAAAERGARSDRPYLEKTISSLSNRVFLLHNIHRGAPQVFQTRWALSFLRGPMSREEIARLMEPVKRGQPLAAVAAPAPVPAAVSAPPPVQPAPAPAAAVQSAPAPAAAPPAAPVVAATAGAATAVPRGVDQFFLAVNQPNPGGALVYRAFVFGAGDIVGEDKKMGRRYPRAVRLLAAAPADGQPVDWAKAEPVGTTESRPQDSASLGAVPASLDSVRKVDALKKAFADHLAGVKVQVPTSEKLNMSLDPSETLDAFRARCQVQAFKMFEKKWQDEAAMYQSEFSRYRAAVPPLMPVAPNTPWEERWKAYLPGSAVRRAIRAADLSEKEKADLERLEKEWHGVESNHADICKRYAEEFKNLLLTPKKGDVKVSQFGLAWAPFWVVPGQPEVAAYR